MKEVKTVITPKKKVTLWRRRLPLERQNMNEGQPTSYTDERQDNSPAVTIRAAWQVIQSRACIEQHLCDSGQIFRMNTDDANNKCFNTFFFFLCSKGPFRIIFPSSENLCMSFHTYLLTQRCYRLWDSKIWKPNCGRLQPFNDCLHSEHFHVVLFHFNQTYKYHKTLPRNWCQHFSLSCQGVSCGPHLSSSCISCSRG